MCHLIVITLSNIYNLYHTSILIYLSPLKACRIGTCGLCFGFVPSAALRAMWAL